MSRYRNLVRVPKRIALIRTLMRLAQWLARPHLAGVKVGQHFDIAIEMSTSCLSNGSAYYRVDQGRLLINNFEVCAVLSPEAAETEKLLSVAESIFLGADDQNPENP